jgi:hypothetical protein
MRVMLDENIPRQVMLVLQDHLVSTIEKEGWKGIANGALLDRIENKFDVLITSDGHMLRQNRFLGRKLSLIMLPTNRLAILLANANAIRATLIDLASFGFSCAVEIGWNGQRRLHRFDQLNASARHLPSVAPFAVRP